MSASSAAFLGADALERRDRLSATGRSATSRGRSSPTAERQRQRAAQRARSRTGARSTPACSSTSWRTNLAAAPRLRSSGGWVRDTARRECAGLPAPRQRPADLLRRRADLPRRRAGRRHRRLRRRHRPGRHDRLPRPRPRGRRARHDRQRAARDPRRPPRTRATCSLRYVQCPLAPFLGSDRQNVCEGS